MDEELHLRLDGEALSSEVQRLDRGAREGPEAALRIGEPHAGANVGCRGKRALPDLPICRDNALHVEEPRADDNIRLAPEHRAQHLPDFCGAMLPIAIEKHERQCSPQTGLAERGIHCRTLPTIGFVAHDICPSCFGQFSCLIRRTIVDDQDEVDVAASTQNYTSDEAGLVMRWDSGDDRPLSPCDGELVWIG
jgi:hypothetical protein